MTTGPRELPPILKDARELRRLVELAVGKFSRAHRYDLGADLRRDARAVMRAGIDARVIAHARAKLAAWEQRHVQRGRITRDAEAIAGVRSVWASYDGHFRHANSHRLRARFHLRFPWLEQLA